METQSNDSSKLYIKKEGIKIETVIVSEIETLSGSQPAEEIVLVDNVRWPGQEPISRAFPVAKKPQTCHFNPYEVNAAIVTCGGLCPGAFCVA
jgi:hypothetical protein